MRVNGDPGDECSRQYAAPSVRESSTSESADSSVEKILAPIELHDVIAWSGIRHQSIPGPHFLTPSTLTFKVTV
jgi:hypothetical protein